MDFKQIQTFLIAAETLNFTKTAQQLDFAQSSITAQIKTLENELQTPLFQRLGKRIYLTDAGIQFQQYAKKMVSLHEEMQHQIQFHTNERIILTIGAQESQCTYRLPAILKQFKQLYPMIQIIFKPVHSKEIAKTLLENGELDLAFITDELYEYPMLKIQHLIEEKLIFVFNANDFSISSENELRQALASQPLLLTEQGCSYRSELEKAFMNHHIYPKKKIEFVSIEAIKQCVHTGIGIAYLPTMAVDKELKNHHLHAFHSSLTNTPIYTQLAWHKSKELNKQLQTLIKITVDYYNTISIDNLN